jgi:hypothetical protein
MTIVEGLHAFFQGCPLMTENRIHVDYLPTDAKGGVEFSIDATPGTDTVAPYLDGGGMCQYQFVLRSVNDYGPDTLQNITNNGFYDGLMAWLRTQSRKRRLPAMPEGMQAIRIRALSTAYLFEMGASVGKYQIQCQLDYYRKGER